MKIYWFCYIVFVFFVSTAVTNVLASEIPSDPEEIMGEAQLIISDEILKNLRATSLGEDISCLDDSEVKEALAYYPDYPRKIDDSAGNKITIYKPIERVVILNSDAAECFVIMHAQDRVVGVSQTTQEEYSKLFPELSKKIDVGHPFEPDLETILACDPEIIIAYCKWPSEDYFENKIPESVKVARFDFYNPEKLKEELLKLGYLLDTGDYVDKYVQWHDEYVNLVEDGVSEIPDENRVRVFIDSNSGENSGLKTSGNETGIHNLCVQAGGKNVANGYVTNYANVETEWVMKQNPDFILGLSFNGGYDIENNSNLMSFYEDIMNNPYFKDLNGVKDNRVHVITNSFALSPHYPVALVALAKWFYPDKFSDLDPEKIHQEYINMFFDINYSVSEQGSFYYPK